MPDRRRNNSSSTPTLSEVADAANVSSATVSRAFSRPELLSRETVARVHSVAARLGYVPNHAARALSTGRMGNIALIVPDITNPFFAAMMRGGQATARECGYATFIGDSDETPEVEDILLTKLSAQVEGFIIASSRLHTKQILEHARRRPCVLVNRDIPGMARLLVDSGPSYGQALEHLVSLGHRSIAYVAGPAFSWSNSQRYGTVTRRAAELGVEIVRVPTSRPSFEAGQACVDELVLTGATAVLAFDDVMAQGIMAGLAARGLSVPGDYSVIGCDGILAPTLFPPLTSIATHCAEAGRQAVELLVAMLQGKPLAHKRINLVTEFVIRATTQAPCSQRETAGLDRLTTTE
ncbi:MULTISPECIES: LacI family DNA-binding transcriptional regulator [unclassified Mesorhizobium]|uniref:LacI family DNA-binding transcriptional regulator n=1 Tax=unclassified Mesorhizobium TaxID=325217 RepID=UPI001FEDD0B9|nr:MULTISPECIES: LacI family DNA-binding transcriptional regulator [unclassified Mesorhizobium]